MQVASRVAKSLKTDDLRKLGNIRKVSKLHRMPRAQPPCHKKKFVSTSKKMPKNSD